MHWDKHYILHEFKWAAIPMHSSLDPVSKFALKHNLKEHTQERFEGMHEQLWDDTDVTADLRLYWEQFSTTISNKRQTTTNEWHCSTSSITALDVASSWSNYKNTFWSIALVT